MRISLKSFFILFTVILGYVFSQTTFAQDFSGGYDLSGGEEDEANLFLQNAIAEDNALKTKAEIFNGKRSGVYEGDKLSCPYAFERDLFVGTKGEDVRLLQVLLNSDRRTLIAVSGPGSLGQESDSFGEATKEAVKKFQALFIEYTGVANGRFGPRTRTVMNAICNGENKPSNANSIEARQNRNIYENIFSVQRGAVPGGIVTTNAGGNIDSVPPRVSLSANVSSVKMGETFKVIVNASEEIVPISPDSLIVDGGTVKEIRKLSKTSYTATIIINEEEGVKKVLVQVEADKIEDLAGNKNEDASNEISVKVISETKVASEGGEIEGEVSINSLLDKIISAAPTCSYNGSGILITIGADGKQLNTTGCAQTQSQNLAGSGQTYNCNGQQIPVTQPCQNQQTQTVCTTSVNPLTGMPQQQCQQMTQQQVAAAQQAQQDQQFGQMLGSLLRQGFGQGQNGQGNPGANNNFNPGGTLGFTPQGTIPGGLPNVTPGTIPKDPAKVVEQENKFQSETKTEIAKLEDEIKKMEGNKNLTNMQTKELGDKRELLAQKKDALAISEYREEVTKNQQLEAEKNNACKKEASAACDRAKSTLEASNKRLEDANKKLDAACTDEKKAASPGLKSACENALNTGEKKDGDKEDAGVRKEDNKKEVEEKSGIDNNDRVVRELTSCHNEYPGFRTKEGETSSVNTRTFLMKKKDKRYLLIAKKNDINSNVNVGACLLQQPDVLKDAYKHNEFDTCFSGNWGLTWNKTNVSDHIEVEKGMAVKIYQGTKKQLQAGECKKPENNSAAKKPQDYNTQGVLNI